MVINFVDVQCSPSEQCPPTASTAEVEASTSRSSLHSSRPSPSPSPSLSTHILLASSCSSSSPLSHQTPPPPPPPRVDDSSASASSLDGASAKCLDNATASCCSPEHNTDSTFKSLQKCYVSSTQGWPHVSRWPLLIGLICPPFPVYLLFLR